MRINPLHPFKINQGRTHTNTATAFGVNRDTRYYDDAYKQKDTFNGALPDEFILIKLNQFFPNPQNINVLDIGAGQGRNSCPIAKNGYNVTASELSEDGIKSILEKAKEDNLSLTTISRDILVEDSQSKNKYNFVFMSHITQIFNEEKLDIALSNIQKSMKNGGILVFDALVRNKGQENIRPSEEYSKSGYYNYSRDEIVKIAKSKGFEVVEISDYSEKDDVKSFYISHPKWNENVKLQWFVLKN